MTSEKKKQISKLVHLVLGYIYTGILAKCGFFYAFLSFESMKTDSLKNSLFGSLSPTGL